MRRFVRYLRPLQTLVLTPTPTTAPAPLRLLSTASSSSSSAAAASSDSDSAAADFNSADFSLPPSDPVPVPASARNPFSALRKLRFDPSLRARADEALFGKEAGRGLDEAVEEERSREVALALLEAALEPPDEDERSGEVREEDQMALSVGIVGAPNTGKSSLTNTMVPERRGEGAAPAGQSHGGSKATGEARAQEAHTATLEGRKRSGPGQRGAAARGRAAGEGPSRPEPRHGPWGRLGEGAESGGLSRP